MMVIYRRELFFNQIFLNYRYCGIFLNYCFFNILINFFRRKLSKNLFVQKNFFFSKDNNK